ncbi:glycoside hydrolase superfamily [Phascolomyces articulosus]|uniref:glucan endo-1,3-beta-D-glucosidase n=1 Tax=Phascolomyces articulosus TaxID=60185 RepID=A0AAD5PG53_9FUNG|nr:glycoside hydrolase superfamily [Phascolomyces articulosus]
MQTNNRSEKYQEDPSYYQKNESITSNKQTPSEQEEGKKTSNDQCCGSKRASYILKGCIFTAILLIITALVVLPQVFGGLTSSGNNDDKARLPTPPSTDDPPTENSLPHKNNTFTPDPRLHQAFYGIDYTPHGTLYQQNCGIKYQDVIKDINILRQLTTRIRLYGMDCDQASLVLKAIKQLKINMGVVLTLWVDGNSVTYKRQYNAFWNLLKEFGGDHIIGVSVGNEAIFRKQIATNKLIQLIKDVKHKLTQSGYPHIPVYTTEIKDLPQLIPEEDAVLDNVHPFFAGTLAKDAANWTWEYFYNVDQFPTLLSAKQLGLDRAQTKPAVISEIGWPTHPKDRKVQAAEPSIDNQRILLETFVCEANRRQLPYFWFEFKDQPWKAVEFNETRESYWGLFDKDLKLKHARLPNCQVDQWQKGNHTVIQPEPLGSVDLLDY